MGTGWSGGRGRSGLASRKPPSTHPGSAVCQPLAETPGTLWQSDCKSACCGDDINKIKGVGHGAVRQMCLAHLLRDAKYAIEDRDTVFTPGFRRLLLWAVAIGKRRDTLKDTTLAQYQADLDRRLSRLLSGSAPTNKPGRRLFRAMRRDRDDLFRFVTRRDVPYTNNACERALRPSVIFRKVTNGFRTEWGGQVYAAAASVMATGRLHGLTALQAIRAALAGLPVMQSG